MCCSEKLRTLVGDANEIYSIDILGEKWDVVLSNEKNDPELKNNDGYTFTKVGARRIVVGKDSYLSAEHILRHELIHAFLFETGLGFCSNWAHNEEMVDYFARNWTKIDKIMNDSIDKIIKK